MDKIGIMTFHAAHNYGSVLQAYATQKILRELGYENVIINYRLKNQKEFYNSLYTSYFGIKNMAKSLLRLPEHGKRRLRNEKFEDFIYTMLDITEKEYGNYYELKSEEFDFTILISGSDQIWNKYCTAEFKKEPPESILGYFLAFGAENVKRISISSSFGSSKLEDIVEYKMYLEKYRHLSVREDDGATMLSDLLARKVENTLDPTLLFGKEQWNIKGTYKVAGNYLFVYTLRRDTDLLETVVKIFGGFFDDVVCVAPFCMIRMKGVKSFAECGPLDFISYIRGAKLVITDSFHGTAFSVNLERPFYTIKYGTDRRKEQLLTKLHLSDRLLNTVEEIAELNYSDALTCNFDASRDQLELEREKSIRYLINALKEE